MVVGRDGDALDALVLWFGGSWSFGFWFSVLFD